MLFKKFFVAVPLIFSAQVKANEVFDGDKIIEEHEIRMLNGGYLDGLSAGKMNTADTFDFISFDLNDPLRDCVASGGACLSDIPIINVLFGGGRDAPMHTDESFCRAYSQNWCKGPTGYPSGFDECRMSKKKLYKHAKQKYGSWPSKEEFERKYPSSRWKPKSDEQTYFDEIEESKKYDARGWRKGGDPYFNCTPRQVHLWHKNRCSHTAIYQLGKHTDYSPAEWQNMKTQNCNYP